MAEQSEALNRPVGAAPADLAPWQRIPMLVLGFASLLLGLLAGEARVGWAVPLPRPELILLHGPLMVSGFLGTLIGLERAVAVGRRFAYLGPAASAAGAVVLIAGAPVAWGAVLFTLGALGLMGATFVAYRRQPAFHTLTLLLGAGAWLVGNLLWLGGAGIHQLVPWWAGFLILTIAGERLELSRLLRPTPAAHRLFAWLVALLLAALAAISLDLPLAREGLALTLLGLTAWLVRNDIARRTISSQGLTRFMAVCLLSGYAWLAIGALIGLSAGGMFAGPSYDATLHAVFLGFVFSMIFGHAPVILPSVTRLAVPFHPLFYVHWGLLQVSLILRVTALPAGQPGAYRLAAALNGIAIVVFIVNTVSAVVRGRLRRAARA
jgi:hypothetical protein